MHDWSSTVFTHDGLQTTSGSTLYWDQILENIACFYTSGEVHKWIQHKIIDLTQCFSNQICDKHSIENYPLLYSGILNS